MTLRVCMAPDYRVDNPYQALLAAELDGEGVRVTFPSGYRRGMNFSRLLRGEARPDVLHLHWISPYLRLDSGPGQVIYGAKLAADLALVRALGVRLVWTVHNLIAHDAAAPQADLWCRRQVAALADQVIVHHQDARAQVAETYRISSGRIAVIPHGHYGDFYSALPTREAARSALGLQGAGRILLFFGMIRPYKGVLRLIRAWQAVPSDGAPHWLVIAGDARDPALAAVINAAAEGVRNLRLHLQFIPDAEVPTYFGAANAVVLPFERSLTSGSVALAATWGLPVVAPRLPAVTAVTGADAPLLYNPEDEAGLEVAIYQALADPLVPTTRPPGWDAIAALHLALYQEVIAARRLGAKNASIKQTDYR